MRRRQKPWEQNIEDYASLEHLEPAGAPSWGRHLGMAVSVAACLALAVMVGLGAIMLRQGFAFQVAVGDASVALQVLKTELSGVENFRKVCERIEEFITEMKALIEKGGTGK